MRTYTRNLMKSTLTKQLPNILRSKFFEGLSPKTLINMIRIFINVFNYLG